MAKKRIFSREFNRQKIVNKYYKNRESLKKSFYIQSTLRDRIQIQNELQTIPRTSTPFRLRNRCQLSGRSRRYYRNFGLSRHFIRELANQGILPGIRKSSW